MPQRLDHSTDHARDLLGRGCDRPHPEWGKEKETEHDMMMGGFIKGRQLMERMEICHIWPLAAAGTEQLTWAVGSTCRHSLTFLLLFIVEGREAGRVLVRQGWALWILDCFLSSRASTSLGIQESWDTGQVQKCGLFHSLTRLCMTFWG